MTAQTDTITKLAEDHVRSAFPGDVADHQLEVKLDQGLYRHLSFRRPSTGMYGFDLITTPGRLTITGDMGTYTFARALDMFDFFASKPGYINASYWGEKLTSVDASAGYKRYSEDLFEVMVRQDVQMHLDDFATALAEHNLDLDEGDEHLVLTQDQIDEVWGAVENDLLDYGYDQDSAHNAVRTFSHTITVEDLSERIDFTDSWEMDFNDYSFQYIWCLHAIVWGINAYAAATQVTDQDVQLLGGSHE